MANQKATALLHTAAEKAEVSSAEAKAAQAAATGTAKDLKEKADRAIEVASFDANNRATREAIATGNTIAPELVPTAPVIPEAVQALTTSPARSQRPASSNMLPRGMWFTDGLGSCFGGGNGGPSRRASTAREPSARRRRKWPNVEDE